MEKHPDNYYIYCSDPLLKRRVSKVYHTKKNNIPIVYNLWGESIELSSLDKDYMILTKFNPYRVALPGNRQNYKNWLYKLKNKGYKRPDGSNYI